MVVPEQIVVVPDSVAVGNGVTVTVADPVSAWLQIGAVVVAALTKV